MIDGGVTYLAGARFFLQVLAQVRESDWDRPGLGVWNVRALAGHTSRALVTVLTYVDRPAEQVDIESAAEYYALLSSAAPTSAASDDVARRGIAAGEALGEDPAGTVRQLLERVEAVLADVPDKVITTIAGGMRLSDYLPTRTFELAVHTLDLAAACGIRADLPRNVGLAAAELAAQIAVVRGDGARLLLALTGRTGLPPGFSVA